MKKLRHPSIVQFVDVYEDADRLMMVMEFCPGNELFDVILARKYFKEEDAKPIFAQIARALHYLHSLSIIHRDIKPENILIMDQPDPVTGQIVAKLLDFGLSKSAAGGSAAKTFVGTPCYLAPEVEYTSRGLGGTYGLPADCWSLGAVLYVMLVARFPEFEQDRNGKVVVKLNPALWNNISSDAKDLIRGLMDTDPETRLSAEEALQHPWLGAYSATIQELHQISHRNSILSKQLQEEEEKIMKSSHIRQQQLRAMATSLTVIGEEGIEGGEDVSYHMQDSMTSDVEPVLTATGAVVYQQAMILRQGDGSGKNYSTKKPSIKTTNNTAVPTINTSTPSANTTTTTTTTTTAAMNVNPDSLRLAPLLHLQK